MPINENAKKAHKCVYDIGQKVTFFHDHSHNALYGADDIRKMLGLKVADVKKYSQEVYIDGTLYEGIPESAVYRMLLLSTKKWAKDFQKWVFEVVLPTIRKTGKYDQFFTKE